MLSVTVGRGDVIIEFHQVSKWCIVDEQFPQTGGHVSLDAMFCRTIQIGGLVCRPSVSVFYFDVVRRRSVQKLFVDHSLDGLPPRLGTTRGVDIFR